VSVVSDASPLVSLARLGHLELLHELYGDVLVAVWQELVVQGAGQPGAAELGRAPWIRRCTVGNRPLVEALWQHLGAGEAEAIALAAELLLMDERLGREAARRVGVRVVGVAGVRLECPVSEGCVHFMGLAPDHDLSSP
jgi:predicted nucleic acid-binding protein